MEKDLKELEEIILSAKGETRWELLKRLAPEYDYTLEEKDSYRYNKDYLMKTGKRIIYLEDVTSESYKEIKDSFKRKKELETNNELIGYARSIGGSTLGGGLLGYLLIHAGLNPLIMIPSILIPPGILFYKMLKQSIKDINTLAEINKVQKKYEKNIFYDDNAAKRFNHKLYER